MCHFQIRKTYHFQMRKINLFQIRKRVIFKYEKCDLYVFSNTNVTYFCIKRHAIGSRISDDCQQKLLFTKHDTSEVFASNFS